MDSPRSISRAEWLIGLLLGLLEVIVVATLAIVLTTNGYGAGVRSVSPVGLALVLLGTYSLAMVLFGRHVSLGAARLIGLAAGLVLTLGVLRFTVYPGYAPADLTWLAHLGRDLWRLTTGLSPALTGLIFCLLCWWLGLNLASEPLRPDRVLAIARAALFGLIAAFLIAGAALDVPAVRAALARSIPLAFVCALAALSLARLETVRADARARGGSAPTRLPWIGTTIVTTGILLLLALVAGQVLGLGYLRTLLTVATTLANLLARVLYLFLLAFSYMVFFLLTPLIWLIRHALGRAQQPQPQPDTNPSPFERLQHDTTRGIPVWLILGMNGLFVTVVVSGAVVVLYRALRRYRSRQHTMEVIEERESVWSADLLLAGLRNAFAARWRHRPRGPSRAPRRHAAQSVREVYAEVCAAAAAHGLPRLPAETPTEYAARLCQAWPEAEGYWVVLTEAYRRVRYGGITPSPGEWRAVEAGWRQLRQRWEAGSLTDARDARVVPATGGD